MRSDALVLIIDVQEKLHPAIEPGLRAQLEANLPRVVEASTAFGVPILVTEQYPKGLGPTLPWLKDRLPAAPLPKLSFDALADPAVEAAFLASGRRTVIVAGMETHICVFQTVRSLVNRGIKVLVLADAVGSRTRQNYEIGLGLAKDAGAVISSTEAVLFDWVGGGGTEDFKLVSRLVR
ncbi:MAG: isochorismatase family protein [Myxococcota bacterium]